MHARDDRITWLGVISLGSMDAQWRRVATKHTQFAHSLANLRMRFDRDFIKRTEKFIGGCRVKKAKTEGLGEAELKPIELFAEGYCKPWLLAWVDALAACEDQRPPDWCSEDESARKRLDPSQYYATLTAALRESTDPLEGYNTIAAMLDSTEDDDIARFPTDEVESWLSGGLAQYLNIASAEDVIDIAQWTSETWVGMRPSLAALFEKYAGESAAMSPEQRTALRKIATNKQSED